MYYQSWKLEVACWPQDQELLATRSKSGEEVNRQANGWHGEGQLPPLDREASAGANVPRIVVLQRESPDAQPSLMQRYTLKSLAGTVASQY